jgi:dTDP-4-dehydrorhamnose 3,5-epimerase
VSRLQVIELPLAGLRRVERTRLSDERGFFSRLFCAEELKAAGWHKPVAQINHTMTQTRGTVRGMHFQRAPAAEMKLVSCVQGEVWDVAVDLRRDSPTFLQWHAEVLSADNDHAMLIPEGFAHGFQALSDSAHLVYCHSHAYSPAHEAGVHPLEAHLQIDWPHKALIQMSPRDAGRVMLDAHYQGE